MDCAQNIYAPSRDISSSEGCYFYHTIELPEVGLINGAWDLRGSFDEYMGRVSFANKRVLEVGTANGFLCFEMEKRGADVVGYDLSINDSWDIIPYSSISDEMTQSHREHIDSLNKAWWLGHRLMKSKAQVVYGSVYNIPKEIGPVDISTFGSILLHLRDPFLALQKAAILTTETIIVTDLMPPIINRMTDWLNSLWQAKYFPRPVFLPNPDKKEPLDTWWVLPPDLIIRYLKILGFNKIQVSYHRQKYGESKVPLYTVAGTRS